MRYFKKDDFYVLIIDRGEELISSVIEFCQVNDIKSSFVNGIGAISDVEIGYFDIKRKEYIRKHFEDSFELVNLSGNISVKNGSLIFHPHVTLGRQDYSLIGGHLFNGKVSVTAEIFLYPLTATLIRKRDNFINLDLIQSD